MQQYLRLIVKSFQTSIERRGKCVAVAFTSSLPKEGVSHVVESFGLELAQRTGKQTLIVDARRLQSLSVVDYIRMPQCCYQPDTANLWLLPLEETGETVRDGSERYLQLQMNPNEESEFGLGNVQALRIIFDYVLIDCPALSVSDDAAILASSVDGVVVVVEADKTNQEQISRTRRTLEMANGKLLGFVLNKRQYPVPKWLYKRL